MSGGGIGDAAGLAYVVEMEGMVRARLRVLVPAAYDGRTARDMALLFAANAWPWRQAMPDGASPPAGIRVLSDRPAAAAEIDLLRKRP